MYNMILIFIFASIVLVSGCFAKSPLLSNSVTDDDDGCACKTYSCGCCLTMQVPEIKLNDTACVNFAYLPDEYGISVTLTIDDYALINETISARNPPPVCIEPPFMEPYIKNFIHLCLRFYDIKVTSALFHSCVKIEIKMFFVFSLKEYELGCFDIDLVKLKHTKYLEQVLKNNTSVTNDIPNEPKKKFLKSAHKGILTPSRW